MRYVTLARLWGLPLNKKPSSTIIVKWLFFDCKLDCQPVFFDCKQKFHCIFARVVLVFFRVEGLNHQGEPITAKYP